VRERGPEHREDALSAEDVEVDGFAAVAPMCEATVGTVASICSRW
jgi:hypothetical protein